MKNLIIVFIGIVVIYFGCKILRLFKAQRSKDISETKEFILGGYKQTLLIEAKNSELPILITVHCGPGSAIPFNVGCRGMFPELTSKFILVCWDQLG